MKGKFAFRPCNRSKHIVYLSVRQQRKGNFDYGMSKMQKRKREHTGNIHYGKRERSWHYMVDLRRLVVDVH